MGAPAAGASAEFARVGPGRATTWEILGYKILEEIGRGGMGVVYKAWHAELKRLVAIKMVRDGHLADGSAFKRFRVAAVARLEHPNIVQIFDVGGREAAPMRIAGSALLRGVRVLQGGNAERSGRHSHGDRGNEGGSHAYRQVCA